MARKIKKSNPILVNLIQDVKKKAYENNAPIWKDIAERLERPLKNWAEVNVGKLEKCVRDGEIALVPGKVLSGGNLNKGLTVAAWKFSRKARDKIERVGGKCISIEELVRINPKGSGVRIVG